MLYNTQWEKKAEVEPAEWRRVLLDAAELIDCYGWCQGQLGNEDVGFCSIGAIERVTHNYHNFLAGREALFYLSEFVGSYDCLVAQWNDDKQRTSQQVVDAMRGAAVS